MTAERLALARKALRYRALGLTLAETGKLIDRKKTCVQDLLHDAALVGMRAKS